MNPIPAAAAFLLLKLFRDNNKLTLKTVQAWIDELSDGDRNGTGYSGNRLSRGPSSGYVEITKTTKFGGFEIRASVYFDPRQGAATSKSWNAVKLDNELDKYFGKNRRVRMNI